MVEIVSLRASRPAGPFDVIVDRRSPLGNPFRMTVEEDRERVCSQYEVYFQSMLSGEAHVGEERRAAFLAELSRLADIYRVYRRLRLFCWCAPRRCHAETIRNFLLASGQK